MKKDSKVILAIMDGVGLRDEEYGNAVKLAKPKFLNKAKKQFPHSVLSASGKAVGLPAGQMGNSEVGHQNIGAGRVVLQELLKINQSIESDEFYKNEVLNQMFTDIKKTKTKLHIIGIVSDGGVHGDIQHIMALLKMAKSKRFKDVYVHVITDGRDTLPKVCDVFLKQLNDYIVQSGYGKIVSLCGRYYAMDREGHFDRTKLAYETIANGCGNKTDDFFTYINENFNNGTYDEFIVPVSLSEYSGFDDNDTVICSNFRADRVRQLTYAIVDKKFSEFKTTKCYKMYSMTSYGEHANKCGVISVFNQKPIKNNLTEVISKAGKHVLKVAETTKYAHVTYFLNGLREKPYKNEDRILHQSHNVATFDLQPKMQANKIAESVVRAVKQNKYDLIVLNFANGDMVGHTGNLKATIKGIKAVDKGLKTIYKNAKNYTLIITADHGNAELMKDDKGRPITSHTTNKVPFIICDKSIKLKNADYSLSNIAPTILDILNLKIPKEMTCESMLSRDILLDSD